MQTHDRPRRKTWSHTHSEVAEPHLSGATESSPRLSVVACSLCLRVLRNSVWIAADEAIRRLRSYELPAPVLLEPGLCDRCNDTIRARRGEARLST
jgi:hypothetical protein